MRRFGFLLLVLFFSGEIQPLFSQAIPVPQLKSRVTDLAHILDPNEAAFLENQLAKIEKQSGPQIFILSVKTLGDESIEQFSIRVADQWKAGSKERDNGLLIVIAETEKKIRIEVGRGLEGVITDVRASRIIREIINPLFKQGRFFDGIYAAVGKIIEFYSNEAESFSTVSNHKEKPPEDDPAFTGMIFLFGVFLLLLTWFKNRKSGKGVKKITVFFLFFLAIVAFISFSFANFTPLLFVIGMFFMTFFARRSRFQPKPGGPVNMSRGTGRVLTGAALGLGAAAILGGSRGGFGGGGSSFSGGGGGGFSGGGASGGW